MLLRLIRKPPDDLAVRGHLYFVTYDVFSEEEVLTLLCPTLENRLYLIPPGRYRLTVTYSPKFKRDLPLVNGVPKAIAPSSSEGAHQGSSAHPSNASGVNQLPEVITTFDKFGYQKQNTIKSSVPNSLNTN